MKKKISDSDSDILRQKAEKLLKKNPSNSSSKLSEAETLKLIHELQVHQMTMIDISEHRKAEKALTESRELYEDLVSNQSAGIYRMLVQKLESGKSIIESASFEFVSDRFCELLEVDKQKLLKDPFAEILSKIHPEDLQGFIKSNEIAQKSVESYIGELRLLIDNRINWLRFESSPRKLENGSIRWTGIVTDITRQKQDEEAHLKNEEKYRLLLELATDAFFQGDRHGNFITVNTSAIEQTGFSRDEILKMNMKDLFSDVTLIEKPLKYDQLRNGEIVKSERELICKDGKPITVEMNSRMMPDGTYQSFFRDITERKLTEKALKRKLNELEIYYELAITRERKMIGLKSEINLLLERMGEKSKY
jgi:PAS domain S-box-containing protein